MKDKSKILIIGGGTGGIMIASQMAQSKEHLEVTLIEPSDTHWYQPAWTLVGAGTYNLDDTKKPMSELIPKGVTWIKDFATGFKPGENKVSTKVSGDISYDYLVVTPGLVMDNTLIEGLAEALETDYVCSNYIDPKKTWKLLQAFKGGNAIFTQPTTPIKCGGAPQKIAYLAADYFRKNGISQKSNVVFATPGTVIFGVKIVAENLLKVVDRYKMHFKPFYAPVKIDSKNKLIHFKNIAPAEGRAIIQENNIIQEKLVTEDILTMPYDFLHLAPPQTAPKFVKESELANETGWLDVNINTLQHHKYPNIFGLGDVAALPTAKTGAAIRKQVPVVLANILQLIKDKSLSTKTYNGYSSCPLVTGYGKMILAEFNYQNEFIPDPKLKKLLIFHSERESWRLWMFKKYGLPYLYWNKMMKGIDV